MGVIVLFNKSVAKKIVLLKKFNLCSFHYSNNLNFIFILKVKKIPSLASAGGERFIQIDRRLVFSLVLFQGHE